MKRKTNQKINEKKSIDQVISQALKIANPTKKDRKVLETVNNEIINKIKNSLLNNHIVEIVTVGSFAKDTFLKNDADIDIFIKFEESVDNKTFEERTLKIGFEVLDGYNPKTRYSEHPYVEGVVPFTSNKREHEASEKRTNHVKINIVPCYNVKKGEWKSSADRSPFHTQYMLEKLDNSKKEQVRLLKLFLKGIGVYGAELSTAGFSGYVAEVLIVKYGTFLSLLDEMANNKEEHKVILIDDEKNKGIDTKIYKEKLISRFSDSSIVIIDPIDHNRNLGTAISKESLSRFILQTRNFLNNPSLDYFQTKEKNSEQSLHSIRRKIDDIKLIDSNLVDHFFSNIIFIEFAHEQMVPDVIWGQILKFKKAIEKQLKFHGFNVLKSSCTTNENDSAVCVFCLESISLPYLSTKEGPSIYMKDSTEKFLENSNNKAIITWTSGEMKLKCAIKREFTHATTLLNYLLHEKINEIGISKGLTKTIHNSFKISEGIEVYKMLNKVIKHRSKFYQYIEIVDDILN